MPKAVVADWKKKAVNDYAKLITSNPIIGVINVESLPAAQLQKMRKQLAGKVVITIGKKRLFKLAIEKAAKEKPGVEKLAEYMKNAMPGLLFTSDNPFSLYKTLQKSKSSAPAKPGQAAPKDIVIPAGPTPFAPGPIIGELGAIGLKTGVEDGKVAIKEDSTVAKEGDIIKPELASVMLRLGIEPMEIGLNLLAAYENGTIFDKKILAVDEQEYIDNLGTASRWAFNLAMFAGIPTKQTVEPMITKAFTNSKAVALESGFMADAVAEEMLAKAERQMMSVSSQVDIDAKMKELETKEEAKPEEKKEEAPKEAPKDEEAKEAKPEEKPEEPKPATEEKKEEQKPQEEPKAEEKKPE